MLFENGEDPIAVGRFEKVGHFVNDDVFEEVLGLLDQLSVEAFLAGAVIAAGSFMWKHCKPPRVRRLNGLDLLGRGGEDGRFQAACGRSDLIAGWAARFAAAQVAGRRVSSLLGRVTGRCSMRCLR